MAMIRGLARLGATLVLAWACGAQAAAPASKCGNECDDVSAWTPYTSADLTLAFPGQADHVAWHFLMDRSKNDIRVDVDATMEGKPSRGSVGMVAGRTLLVKDLEVAPGQEIDALDAPVLTLRLLLALLARTVPSGPQSLDGDRAIDFREPKAGIRYATASASGYIGAPWHVVGHVAKAADGVVRYELHFEGGSVDPASAKTEPVDMALSGKLGSREAPVFDDAMPLTGWKVYGAGAHAASATVGEARAASRHASQ